MNKKIVTFLEISIIILAMAYYIIKIMIPEYKENTGSSDRFINSSQVVNLVEVRIDNQTDFMLAYNAKGRIIHLFFFDNYSMSLYNKSIESQTIENGIERIITILIENQLLRSESQIEILRTDDEKYELFHTSWIEIMNKNGISPTITEEKQDITDRAKQLGIDTDSFSSTLWEIDLYSKEIIKAYAQKQETLDERTSSEYANNIYKKLEQLKNSKDEEEIPISLIPADENHKYYPTDRSWYKIENEKIYAFIEIKDEKQSYAYCYKGTIDDRTKGECEA